MSQRETPHQDLAQFHQEWVVDIGGLFSQNRVLSSARSSTVYPSLGGGTAILAIVPPKVLVVLQVDKPLGPG